MQKLGAYQLRLTTSNVLKLKFGIIGCGSIAEKAFIPALDKADFAELTAVSSRDVNKAKTFSNKFRCDYTNDYDSLLTRDDIDAVYSHTQALGQGKAYLKNIGCDAVTTYDTAGSVKMIKENNMKRAAAIASKDTAELYDMSIIEENIHTFEALLPWRLQSEVEQKT